MFNDLLDEPIDIIVDDDVEDMEYESRNCCSDDRDIDLISNLTDEEVESVEFDEDEDLSIYQDDEDIIYNSNNEYYGTEELETVEKEILDSDVEDLELKED